MKKVFYLLALQLINCTGCTPDSLSNTFDMTDPSGSNATYNTDTTTVAPRIDDSRWADDSISGTVFDRTVRIVFADGGAQVNDAEINGGVFLQQRLQRRYTYRRADSTQPV